MKAVVIAGGKGKRLAPYTTILPKPLMPVGEMPILEILLRQMKRAGIVDIVITVNHLAHLIQTFFQNGEQFGLNIRYSLEDKPLGTAGPLSLVEGLDSTFMVTNGDVLTTLGFADLIEAHQKTDAVATIATYQRRVNIDLGVIQYNGNQEIIGYIEKPNYDFFVSMGIYVFEPRILQYIPYNEYLDFPDLVQKLIDNGEKVMSFPFNGYWQDLGRPDDYEHAIADFENLRPKILGEE